MAKVVTPAQAEAIARAAYTVVSTGGTTALSVADRRGITSAVTTVFGAATPPEVDRLAVIASGDLVRVVEDPTQRRDLVRVLAVLALLDGIVEQAKLRLVLDVASALHVHAEFVDTIEQLTLGHVRWVADDMIRANVATIPGIPWVPDDPYAAFLPYHGDALDPTLASRYDDLGSLAAGTFGRAFHDHYAANGFAFAGHPDAVAEAWATPHDSLHVLSGYSTSAQGELLVAAFTGGQLHHDVDLMQSHVLPTILVYHLGIDINRGLGTGDRERASADPPWREGYDGNVHLGLDAEKLWVAWERGRTMTEDVYSGHWDFWSHIHKPLDELRTMWSIAPLAPAMAAVADADVRREDYVRAGQPPPPLLSCVPISDHPPASATAPPHRDP